MIRQLLIYSTRKWILFLICVALIITSKSSCETNLGYISYSTYNIGDDIQSIAAKRFLPKNSVSIDREFISCFASPSTVNTIVNGWYMHSKDYYWYLPRQPPEKSWPPSPSINPLLISMHFTKDVLPTIFTKEGIEYLIQHGPVGARDLFTLEELQKHHIPCYFSGCLTLTLEYSCSKKDEIIYAIDLDQECVNYIRANTDYPVETLTHVINIQTPANERVNYAEILLEKYKKAHCVITSRLHASMPCLAFETPVLLVNLQPDQYRFDGLRELTHNCSREELLTGQVDFDFDHPPENPKDYIPIRENLISIVTNWVKRCTLCSPS